MFHDDFDRSLPASRRRREQARRDGFVIQSRVLTTGVLLILLGTTWSHLGGSLLQSVARSFQQSLTTSSQTDAISAETTFDGSFYQPTLRAAGMWMTVLLVGAMVAVSLQTRGWFVPAFALPQASRVSPLNNLRRVFRSLGTRVSGSLFAVGISLLLVGGVWLQVSSGEWQGAGESVKSMAVAWVKVIERTTFTVGTGCLAYGLIDLFLRQHRLESNLRMTPAEWEEEQRSARRGPS